MRFYRMLVPLVVLLFADLAFAQIGNPESMMGDGNLSVRITYPNGRACAHQVHVQLMDSSSTTPVAEAFTNDQGMTTFNHVKVGNYHLLVSGEDIETTDSGIFEVDFRKLSQFTYVTVKPKADPNQTELGVGSTVAAVDLNIPADARKEFDKAYEFMQKEQWKKAIERLNKALAIYPKYVDAYTNLGVIYGRLGQPNEERDTLQKAISLNDHSAPALANLARLDIKQHNFADAEPLLNKATAADPNNSQTIVLLANVELLDHHYDEAIANCRKAHSAREPHPLAHYIAARAMEHEDRLADATAELQTLLQEDSSSTLADAARKELASLQSQPQQNEQSKLGSPARQH